MTLEQALIEHLLEDTNVAAQVGTRVKPLQPDQESDLPRLVVQRLSGPRIQTFDGAAAEPASFQVLVTGSTYLSAVTVKDLVVTSLDGYSGVMGGSGGVQCDATVTNVMDDLDKETGNAQIAIDVAIWRPL